MIRLPVEALSTIGRNTQGVRVINLGKGDKVIDMTRLPKSEDEILEGEGEGEGEVDGAKVAENGETASEVASADTEDISEVASGDTDENTPTEDTE